MTVTKENKPKKNDKESIIIKDTLNYKNFDVKNIRLNLKMTQKQFAEIFGVSVKTIEAWENGRNRPNGAAMRLLEICEKNPNVFVELNIINLT